MNFIYKYINIQDFLQSLVINFYNMALYYPFKCDCECHKVPLLSQISPASTTRHNYVSAPYAPYRINSNRQVLKINMVICLDQNVSNIIPKIGTSYYNDLNFRGMIKKDFEIPIHSSSAEIYNLFCHLFPDHLNGKRLCLFNSSSGILKEVSYSVSKKILSFLI
jgi:hypothetical protein